MSGSLPEWIMASASIGTAVFVGIQSWALSSSLETPYRSTLQNEAIEVCAGLRANLQDWTRLGRLKLFAWEEQNSEFYDEEDMRQLRKELFAVESERNELLARARYILPDVDEVDELTRLVDSVNTHMSFETLFSQEESRQLVQQGVLADDETVAGTESMMNEIFESIDQKCLNLARSAQVR